MIAVDLIAVAVILADNAVQTVPEAPAGMTAVDVVTLVVAIIGAVTGVAGTVMSLITHRHQLASEKVNLRVGIAVGVLTPSGVPALVLNVANLSKFAVDLALVGLQLKDGSTFVHLPYRTLEGKLLPLRMEPRSTLKFAFTNEHLLELEDVESVVSAFGETDCAERFEGGHRNIRKLIENVLHLATLK